MQYNALTKTERTRYKAAKKLVQYLVNLLRRKALENTSKGLYNKLLMYTSTCKTIGGPNFDSSSITSRLNCTVKSLCFTCSGCEANRRFPLPHTSTGPTSRSLQWGKQLHNTMSATEVHPHPMLQRTRRSAQSGAAGAGRPKDAAFPLLPISLPEVTLRAALEDAARTERRNQDGEGHYIPKSLEWTKGDTKGLLDFDQDLLLRKLPENSRSTSGISTDNIGSTANPARQNGFSDHSCDDPSLQQSSRHWTLLSFCYKCGRSTGVRLLRCPGCRAVCYCSQSCRAESWTRGHQYECTGAQVYHGHSLSKKKHRAKGLSRAGKIARQQ